jgi:hypothetical protein
MKDSRLTEQYAIVWVTFSFPGAGINITFIILSQLWVYIPLLDKPKYAHTYDMHFDKQTSIINFSHNNILDLKVYSL